MPNPWLWVWVGYGWLVPDLYPYPYNPYPGTRAGLQTHDGPYLWDDLLLFDPFNHFEMGLNAILVVP
jgi:hypothetical protein